MSKRIEGERYCLDCGTRDNLYSCVVKGETIVHRICRECKRRKIVQNNTGRKHPPRKPEHLKNISSGVRKAYLERGGEIKEKLRKAQIGKKLSEETKKKMSESHIGRDATYNTTLRKGKTYGEIYGNDRASGIKEKIKKSNVETYADPKFYADFCEKSKNNDTSFRTPEYKERISRGMKKFITENPEKFKNFLGAYGKNKNKSKEEEKLYKNLCEDLCGVAIENFSHFTGENPKGKTNIFPDIYIPFLNLVIEYDGRFFHQKKLDRDVERDEILWKNYQIRVIHYIDYIPPIEEILGDYANLKESNGFNLYKMKNKDVTTNVTKGYSYEEKL